MAAPGRSIIGADSTMRSNQRLPAYASAQQHRAAHRMGKREMRRRTVRQHHLLHEGFDVDLVVGEVADIAFARIAQAARRMALPAPVDGRHRKAAVAQVAHGLEIFLDQLAAALKHADRALATRRRRPARKAQLGAVRRLDGAADDVFGNGIGGNGDERHGESGEESAENQGREDQKGSESPS